MGADEQLVITGADMTEGRLLPVDGGAAAVFSARCPDKQTSNEDAAAVCPVPGGVVLAVADGVGGLPGGELASSKALTALLREVRRASADGHALREGVLRGFDAANAAVRELGMGAATTLVVAEIDGGVVRTYHAGDSTALVVGQRGRIKHKSVDHSPVGYAVEAGVLDEEEALHHDDRNVVSNVVGSPEMHIALGPAVRLAAHDTVLLASDGLSDNLAPQQIVALVRHGPLDRACAALARESRRRMTEPHEGEPSKPDDLTFVLFRPTRSRDDLRTPRRRA